VPGRLPLFPLGLVLVPGQPLPLHVFEPRYRSLMQELLARPEPERRFGVVAIRTGREVGAGGAVDLHAVGCTAAVVRVHAHPDGRFDLVTTGTDRFHLRQVSTDRPYLVGEIEPLPERTGEPDQTALLAPAVAEALHGYLRALGAAGAGPDAVPELPADPRVLSYLVAAAVRVDLADRQALLEAPDDTARLRAGLAVLRREGRLMRALSAVPAPELTRLPLSPN
jgi:uncharacterized protein